MRERRAPTREVAVRYRKADMAGKKRAADRFSRGFFYNQQGFGKTPLSFFSSFRL
jgi:hypothetical protein